MERKDRASSPETAPDLTSDAAAPTLRAAESSARAARSTRATRSSSTTRRVGRRRRGIRRRKSDAVEEGDSAARRRAYKPARDRDRIPRAVRALEAGAARCPRPRAGSRASPRGSELRAAPRAAPPPIRGSSICRSSSSISRGCRPNRWRSSLRTSRQTTKRSSMPARVPPRDAPVARPELAREVSPWVGTLAAASPRVPRWPGREVPSRRHGREELPARR